MRSGALATALVATLALGCDPGAGPNLVRVDRIEPGRASAGDRILITGDGFPAGRAATVEFRGDLFRPGAEPRRDVSIRLRAAPEGRNALTMSFDQDAERRFTGTGIHAAHSTFAGQVRVTFQPGSSGLTEVAGTARGVRFDVLPSGDGAVGEVVGAPGSKTLSLLGLVVTAEPTVGLRITELSPGGRAALSGAHEGDLLVDLDGVSVLTEDDLRVRSGERAALLTVERGTERLPLLVDVHGLAPLGTSAWMAPSLALVSSCLFLVLFMTPLGAALRWLSRLIDVARSSDKVTGRSTPPPASRTATEHALLAGQIAVLAFLAAAFVRLAFGRPVASPDLDLTAGPLGATIALIVFRGAQGALARRETPFVSAVAAVLRSLCFTLPALLAILGAVIAGGRFVVAEITDAQGGFPWRWAAAQNPGLFLLAAVLAASVVPEASRSGLPESESWDMSAAPDDSPVSMLVRLAEWTYLWVMLGVTVIVFLGSYRIPGVTCRIQEGSRLLTTLGAALLLCKVGALAAAVRALRNLSRRVLVQHATTLWLKFAAPACVLGIVVSAVWATLVETLSSSTLADFAGFVTTGLLALTVAITVACVKWPRTATNLGVNPWL